MKRPYFSYHSELPPFLLFSKAHLLTLGMILILSVLVFVLRKTLVKKGVREFLRFFIALLLFITDAWQQLWLVHEKAWSLKTALPLQLSDLAVIVAILMLVFKSHRLFQFIYFAGLGSSIQAILTPDLDRFSFPHFQYIEFFISHGGVILACLFMIVALVIAQVWFLYG
jgi:hypothetical integral membrane protein (TIGR02206 family)